MHGQPMPVSGDTQIGLIVVEPTPGLLAIAAQKNIDFIVLDAEQTGLSVRECTEIVHRLSGTGTEIAVRVPDVEERTLISFANTGAAELVLPRIRSVAELETAAAAVKYAPEGLRSRQVTLASGYGADYSRAPRTSVLLETIDALDGIDALVASLSFESGWVGPADLSAELQRAGRGGADALETATQIMVDAMLAAGKPVGLPAPGPAGIASARARGATRVAVYWERYLHTVLEEITSQRS